jgi:DNA gyrase/topoisomerase IV subunit B
MIDILMGNDVAPRKAFIVENSQLLAADALDI